MQEVLRHVREIDGFQDYKEAKGEDNCCYSM